MILLIHYLANTYTLPVRGHGSALRSKCLLLGGFLTSKISTIRFLLSSKYWYPIPCKPGVHLSLVLKNVLLMAKALHPLRSTI